MDRLKSILKNDTEYLREILGLLVCLSLGTYKLFFQDTNRVASLMFGIFLYLFAFLYVLILVNKFKPKKS